MIYNNSSTLQRRFVTGRLTLIFLLSASLLLWIATAFLGTGSVANVSMPTALPAWMGGVLSFVAYMAVAYITNSFVVIEGRVSWVGGVLMWLTALFAFLQKGLLLPLSLLALSVVLSVVISCFKRPGIQLWVYSAFALLSLLTLFVPCAAYLFVLFIVYMVLTEVISIRNILAATLGVLTPVWILFCLSLRFSSIETLLNVSMQNVADVAQLSLLQFTPQITALMIVEAIVMFPCAVSFARSASPAKPLMRKMLTFFITMGIFLWLLSFVKGDDFSLLFAWRLPSLSIMMAYLFTVKINRLTNIYFILVNILFIAVAVLELWNLM